jgi:hypothetical protein
MRAVPVDVGRVDVVAGPPELQKKIDSPAENVG